MNKLSIDEKEIEIKENKVIHIYTNQDSSKVYHVLKNAKLVVYHYNMDATNNIEIHLDGENAEVEYHYNTINYQNHQCKMKVSHHSGKTTSHVYNHGINVLENQLDFKIVGIVEKNKKDCICNQENQIINLKDGNSTILPILLIDHHQVESTHSAYIGKFRDDVIFYMMSRGIEKEKALKLLMSSFLIGETEKCKEQDLLIKEIDTI